MNELFENKAEVNGGGRQHPAATTDMFQGFYDHLLKKHLLAGDISLRFNIAEARRTGKPLQKLWQAMEISAHEFADEVARFFALPRVGLADLMSATSLVDKFSERFLREILHFSTFHRRWIGPAHRR